MFGFFMNLQALISGELGFANETLERRFIGMGSAMLSQGRLSVEFPLTVFTLVIFLSMQLHMSTQGTGRRNL